MASVSFTLTPNSFSSTVMEFGATGSLLTGLEIPASLAAGSDSIFLKYLLFPSTPSFSIMQAAASDSDGTEVGHEDLNSDWESNTSAITLESDLGSVTIPGPAATGSIVTDTSEPYQWVIAFAAAASLGTWLSSYTDGQVIITFDDGLITDIAFDATLQPAEAASLSTTLSTIAGVRLRGRSGRSRFSATGLVATVTSPRIIPPTIPRFALSELAPTFALVNPQAINATLAALDLSQTEAVIAPRVRFNGRPDQSRFEIISLEPTFIQFAPTHVIAPEQRPRVSHISVTLWLREFPSHRLIRNLPGWLSIDWETRWQRSGRTRDHLRGTSDDQRPSPRDRSGQLRDRGSHPHRPDPAPVLRHQPNLTRPLNLR